MTSKDLDQFFTNTKIAENLFQKTLEIIKDIPFDLWLEPSAGNGSFYNLLPTNELLGPEGPSFLFHSYPSSLLRIIYKLIGRRTVFTFLLI